jgi:hypothetical protein
MRAYITALLSPLRAQWLEEHARVRHGSGTAGGRGGSGVKLVIVRR